MKGSRPRQTKHVDCFTSDTPLSSVSVPPVFPFDKTNVTINSVSLTIISTSSILVDHCETIISVEPQIAANQLVPDGSDEIIISAREIIICGAETIMSVLHIIISQTKAIISKRILVIDGPSTIICGPDSIIYIHEAIMSVLET